MQFLGVKRVSTLVSRSSSRLFSAFFSTSREYVRNIAIIAHVDHGKTTLVDRLLSQSNTRLAGLTSGDPPATGESERVMDSNPLERERGITILSKYTSMGWYSPEKKQNYHFNIVDTPGHADFGGEVERIMSMVDGVALVVDATEGPMTQTKFVLSKALARKVLPLVVINKVDRESARLGEVENEIFELFCALGASEEQLDYPVVYASAREGWALKDINKVKDYLSTLASRQEGGDDTIKIAFEQRKKLGFNMNDLFETVITRVPQPPADVSKPFSMLVTQLEGNDFLGKCLVGRIQNGRVKTGDSIKALDPQGKLIAESKVLKLMARVGLEQVAIPEAVAGDIVSIAGLSQATVNSTLCSPTVNTPIPSTPIDPPTLSISFHVNDSPLAGREGESTKLMSSAIRNRLLKEAETNVSIRVMEGENKETFQVQGRGELQLAILIENMRRERYELSVASPKVVLKEEAGKLFEPVEEVIIDVPQEHYNMVLEKMTNRKGELIEMTQSADKRTRLVFQIPTRGLMGYGAEFTQDTRGSGILNHVFHSYVPHKGLINKQPKGALISMESGKVTTYALQYLESRGTLFITPGMEVYPGMVIGENGREEDLEVNPVKSKQLTNVRAAAKDDKSRLTNARIMTLEQLIAYIRDDEMIEVTPSSLRIRKQERDSGKRKKLQEKLKGEK